MEKCKEYWDAHSVTTVFRISKLHHSITGRDDEDPHFTDECGLGWSFAFVTGGDSSSKGSILFNFDNCETDLPYEVKSTVRLLEDVDICIDVKSKSLSLSYPDNHPPSPLEPAALRTPEASTDWLTLGQPTFSETELPGNLIDLMSYPFISITIDLGTDVDVDGKMKSKALKPAIQAVLQRGLFTGICFDIKFLASSNPASSCSIEPIYAYRAVLDIMQPGLLRLCSDSSVQVNENSASPPTADDILKRREWDSEISFDDYEIDSDFDETEIEDREKDPNGTVIEESSPTHSTTRTIRVNGVASKTLKALVYHCYTGEIFFSSLKSSLGEKGQPLRPDRVYCSPKSMYRLADKIGSEELKRLSIQSLRSSLSKNSITHEVFSHFTSRYPEILEIELDFLMLHLDDSEVFQTLSDKLADVASGGVPHSHQILVDIMRRLEALTRSKGSPSSPEAKITHEPAKPAQEPAKPVQDLRPEQSERSDSDSSAPRPKVSKGGLGGGKKKTRY
ncbi:hypothetical protein BJ138DRAFT_1168577 [Hygrophoropsis aurantiaca]|uniref:Uncharacterized protein n=1 Tax=Hygrophoropsis aurantiaca TaxID=72124 RepID=A0ACB7ZPT3_9AGAM|nr:hypothetical protein BJ138DRAFT_1168577 [Hygrophoropsis aurantiaca]